MEFWTFFRFGMDMICLDSDSDSDFPDVDLSLVWVLRRNADGFHHLALIDSRS